MLPSLILNEIDHRPAPFESDTHLNRTSPCATTFDSQAETLALRSILLSLVSPSCFSVPPVTEIRVSFQHKPEFYEVDLHHTRQAILKICKKLMANLASLTCDISNSNNNWKWVLMTKDEYLLAQCRQHGYDPNSKEEVVLGKKEGTTV